MNIFRTNHTKRTMDLRNGRVTRIYIRLITVYLVCVIPICIWNVTLGNENMHYTWNQILGIILYCIYWLQYCINCFIYGISHPKYREAFKQFLRFLMRRSVEPAHDLEVRKSVNPKHICPFSISINKILTTISGPTSTVDDRQHLSKTVSCIEDISQSANSQFQKKVQRIHQFFSFAETRKVRFKRSSKEELNSFNHLEEVANTSTSRGQSPKSEIRFKDFHNLVSKEVIRRKISSSANDLRKLHGTTPRNIQRKLSF